MHNDSLRYLKETHVCPHCEQEMSCCEAPPIHVGDGLGWGSEILFICLNDHCSLFVNGWDNIEQKYGHSASYRYMELPESREGNYMMVANASAFKGSEIDAEAIRRQNKRYQEEKKAVAQLDDCVEEQNLAPALHLILDEAADIKNRKRAISLLPHINDLSCVDPLRNHSFRDTSLELECNQIIETLLKKNYMKECSFCSNLVKMQAKKCMHCKEGL